MTKNACALVKSTHFSGFEKYLTMTCDAARSYYCKGRAASDNTQNTIMN